MEQKSLSLDLELSCTMIANSRLRMPFSSMDIVTLTQQKFMEMKLRLVKLSKNVLQQELSVRIFTSQPSCGTMIRMMSKQQSREVLKDLSLTMWTYIWSTGWEQMLIGKIQTGKFYLHHITSSGLVWKPSSKRDSPKVSVWAIVLSQCSSTFLQGARLDLSSTKLKYIRISNKQGSMSSIRNMVFI